MNKYIDADRLNADLDKWVEAMADAEGDYSDGVRFAIQHFIFLLASLQQEQPEPSGYDKALLEVKSKVDELYEEASIGLSEYDSGLYNGIAETCMKLRGFIKARLDSEEQPEVDMVAKLKHHLATTPKEQLEKEWKELEPWCNVGPTVQEFLYGKQPEVELDKLVNEEFASHSRTTEYGLEATYNRAELYQLIKRIAFVFNARKEESK